MTAPYPTASYRPRRSCLFMPGHNLRAMAKARSLAADMVVLDLEDAVAPEAKPAARIAARAALDEGGFGPRELLVRLNPLGSEAYHDDLAAFCTAPCSGLVLPKVSEVSEIHAIDRALSKAGASADLGLWIMVETPLAILNSAALAACARDTRLAGFMLGTNDLSKDMRAALAGRRMALIPALAQAVMAARAYGIAVLDGVYNNFADEAGLVAEAEQGRQMGFDGKTLIHPSQIAAANRIFAPQPDALAHAEAVVSAFADPANQGRGVVAVGDQMAELLHLHEAERILAIQRAINAAEEQSQCG